MSKEEKASKSKTDSATKKGATSSQPTEKKEPVFDLSDGFSKEDVRAILLSLWRFIKYFIKLILYPVISLANWIKKSIVFLRVPSDNTRTLTEDEKIYVESIPVVILTTGIGLGITISIFALLQINSLLEQLLSFEFTKAIGKIWDAFVWVITGIWTVLKYVVLGIWSAVSAVYDFLNSLVNNPYVAMTILAFIAMIIILLFLVLLELEVFQKSAGVFSRFVNWLLERPEEALNRITQFIRKINHLISVLVIGEDKLNTRSQKYFKRVVGAVLTFSFVFLFIAIAIAWSSPQLHEGNAIQVFWYAIFVCVLFALLAGFFMFWITASVLDLIARGKYTIKSATATS